MAKINQGTRQRSFFIHDNCLETLTSGVFRSLSRVSGWPLTYIDNYRSDIAERETATTTSEPVVNQRPNGSRKFERRVPASVRLHDSICNGCNGIEEKREKTGRRSLGQSRSRRTNPWKFLGRERTRQNLIMAVVSGLDAPSYRVGNFCRRWVSLPTLHHATAYLV